MRRPRWLRVPERVASHPRIAPLKISALRARYVAAPVRFWLREVRQRHGVERYPLRRRGVLYLEHGTDDVAVFDQVFRQGAVAPPAEVAGKLESLGRPPTILDLGANVGCAAAWLAQRFPGSRVVCVEPDPRNLALLHRTASEQGWRVLPAAAGTSSGTLRFAATGSSTSRAREDGDLEVEALDTFALAEEEAPDLVKIDIEGGEWALLADQRLGTLTRLALALEFHAHLAPQGDFRSAAIGALEAAGYLVQEVAHVEGAPREEGSLWAWRHSG